MGKIITFYNHKGGVGKTTLVHNIGFALADLGKKVLMIDADPQMNLTSAMYGLSMSVEYSLFEGSKWREYTEKYISFTEYLNRYLLNDICEKEMFRALSRDNKEGYIDLISGSITLSEKEADLYNIVTTKNDFTRDVPYKFEQSIREKIKEYDFILIDTSPSASSILNGLLLMSSDFFITPVSPTFFSLQAIDNLEDVLKNWIDLLLTYKSTNTRNGLTFQPKFLGVVVQFAKRFKGGDIKTDFSAATEAWIKEANHRAKRFLGYAKLSGLNISEDDFKRAFPDRDPFIIEKCCDYTHQLRSIAENEGIPIIYLTQDICKKHNKQVKLTSDLGQYARSFNSINQSYRAIAENLTKLS